MLVRIYSASDVFISANIIRNLLGTAVLGGDFSKSFL
jgi:hypothetical protein